MLSREDNPKREIKKRATIFAKLEEDPEWTKAKKDVGKTKPTVI